MGHLWLCTILHIVLVLRVIYFNNYKDRKSAKCLNLQKGINFVLFCKWMNFDLNTTFSQKNAQCSIAKVSMLLLCSQLHSYLIKGLFSIDSFCNFWDWFVSGYVLGGTLVRQLIWVKTIFTKQESLSQSDIRRGKVSSSNQREAIWSAVIENIGGDSSSQVVQQRGSMLKPTAASMPCLG